MTTACLPYLLIVDPSIGRTGAFVCAQNMARSLRGRMRALLVVSPDANFTTDDLEPFARSERLRLRSRNRNLPAAVSWLVSVFSSGFRLRKLLLQTKASHLVLNDFYLLQGVICRILGFRGQIITWVRVEPNRTGGRLTSILWALIGLSSNQVISVSHFVEQQIPAWLKTVVIYDCLSLQPDFHSKPARLGRIVYLGNLMPGKGQNYAVEAFAAVADRFPNAVLEFHGGTLGVESNKIWEQQLQRRCKELGLERRISFHGAYSNPFVPLRGADVALNFSDSETFSFTVLEALAAGVPVIATNSGGPAELIDDQVTGVLVLIGDRDAMAQALAERLSDLDATAAMGRAAAQNMAQRFSMEAYRNHLLALLKI